MLRLHMPSDRVTSARQADPLTPAYMPPTSTVWTCNTSGALKGVMCHMHPHVTEYLQDEALALHCTG
jgi:hypothetical protein